MDSGQIMYKNRNRHRYRADLQRREGLGAERASEKGEEKLMDMANCVVIVEAEEHGWGWNSVDDGQMVMENK